MNGTSDKKLSAIAEVDEDKAGKLLYFLTNKVLNNL